MEMTLSTENDAVGENGGVDVREVPAILSSDYSHLNGSRLSGNSNAKQT
jgi:hypothetical protein